MKVLLKIILLCLLPVYALADTTYDFNSNAFHITLKSTLLLSNTRDSNACIVPAGDKFYFPYTYWPDGIGMSNYCQDGGQVTRFASLSRADWGTSEATELGTSLPVYDGTGPDLTLDTWATWDQASSTWHMWTNIWASSENQCKWNYINYAHLTASGTSSTFPDYDDWTYQGYDTDLNGWGTICVYPKVGGGVIAYGTQNTGVEQINYATASSLNGDWTVGGTDILSKPSIFGFEFVTYFTYRSGDTTTYYLMANENLYGTWYYVDLYSSSSQTGPWSLVQRNILNEVYPDSTDSNCITSLSHHNLNRGKIYGAYDVDVLPDNGLKVGGLELTATAVTPSTITLYPSDSSVSAGSTVDISSKAHWTGEDSALDDDISDLGTWSSSDTDIATVDGTTLKVTGVSAGTVTISHVWQGITGTTTLTVGSSSPPGISGTTFLNGTVHVQ